MADSTEELLQERQSANDNNLLKVVARLCGVYGCAVNQSVPCLPNAILRNCNVLTDFDEGMNLATFRMPTPVRANSEAGTTADDKSEYRYNDNCYLS